MADQRGARRKKKKESTAEILAGLSRLIDQTAAKKTKKGPTVVEFQRDPVTCRRVYKSKYRPFCKSARNNPGEIDINFLVLL